MATYGNQWKVGTGWQHAKQWTVRLTSNANPKDPFVCPKKGISLTTYSGDGIQTINPTLGMGLDC